MLVVVSGLCETQYCDSQNLTLGLKQWFLQLLRGLGLKLGSSPRGSPSGDYLSLRETFCLRSGLIQWHGDGGLVFHTNWGHSAMPSQIQHSIQSLSRSLFPGEPNMPQRHRRKKKIIGCLYFRTSYVSIKKTSPSWSNCMRRDFY